MGWVLFLLFVGLPIAEIAVLIQAGGWIGLWPTIGLVVLTAAAGAALARSEGRAAMRRLATAMETGGAPAGPLLDAAAVFLGGVLLLTPGFITDAFGLSLLFAPTRHLWGRALGGLQRRAAARAGHNPGAAHWRDPRARGGPTIIEGEYTEAPSSEDKPDRPPADPEIGPDRRIDR